MSKIDICEKVNVFGTYWRKKDRNISTVFSPAFDELAGWTISSLGFIFRLKNKAYCVYHSFASATARFCITDLSMVDLVNLTLNITLRMIPFSVPSMKHISSTKNASLETPLIPFTEVVVLRQELIP